MNANGEPAAGGETADDLSFEEAVARLERIARALEDGQLGLSQSLAHYEEGVTLLRRCHALLGEAERRIELLVSVDADGQARCEPLADGAGETLDEKTANRAARRGAVQRSKPEEAPGGLFED